MEPVHQRITTLTARRARDDKQHRQCNLDEFRVPQEVSSVPMRGDVHPKIDEPHCLEECVLRQLKLEELPLPECFTFVEPLHQL